MMEPNKFWSIDPSEAVKIRMGTDGIAADAPVTIPECFNEIVQAYPDHPALVYEDGPVKEWKTVTYSHYQKKVLHFAKVFIKLGLEPRHSVGILSFNRPEWFYSNLAAIFAGGLGAGIYTTNSADAVRHILENSRANIVVVEDEKQLEKVKSIKDQLPLLKAIVLLNGDENVNYEQGKGVYLWKDLEEMTVDDEEQKLNHRLAQITPNQSAALIFTSGTVGMPKGVLLSHDTLTWNAKQIENYFQSFEKAKEVIVSYLPLSHIAGQFMDIYYSINNGAAVYLADKNALKGSLINTLRVARPTRFLGVPRVYEKFQEALTQQTKLSQLKRHILNWAKFYAHQHHANIVQGQPTKTWQYLLAKQTILKKVKIGLGMDRCATLIVGAAPATLEVKQFFMSLDLPLMECYGLSEMGGPATLNDRNAFRLDSVGKTLTGSLVKIVSPDERGHGEITMKGRNVFMGYIGEEEKTREALDEDGWLHTGDVGYVDEKGFIFITGRIKELIITAGGENIPPVYVEDLVKSELPCVSNTCLVGDHRKYLTMLITLKTKMDTDTGTPQDELCVETKKWMKEIGLNYTTLSEVIAAGPCPRVLKAIEAGIVRANKNAISNAQKVQKFKLLSHDFSVPTDELGPTLKLKRNVVLKKYANVIEEMYK